MVSATINVVGGFLITDRMLKMFRRDPKPAPGKQLEKKTGGAG
ncbi:MAG TPA: proton-translocating transhydrogenase family protein [Myxococcaceae bacterium]|nr:proton-translocating transhydrogenase family protein [Myxococcaceae bacterium]